MTTTILINKQSIPVRFSMRAMALYFESKGKSLSDLGGLSFSEIQDVYWIAVQEGCRREQKENPYPDENAFFDALDDDQNAMQKLGEAMAQSFGAAEEKNDQPRAKAKKL